MSEKKGRKGQYGYIVKQRKRVIIRTILMFVLALAIFGIGIWSTGTKKNLLTVVAILGCLPASKSAVNMIMFLRAKGCSEQIYEKVRTYGENMEELYDMVFTSYDKNYQVSHLVIAGHVVCGYTEDAKCDTKACEKHLDNLLKQGGCKGVTVKMYQDIEKYCEGLENLKKQDEPKGQDEAKEEAELKENIWINLLSIAL